MQAITSLYQQVWEHPDDDHVRLVLADALEVAGDPRAELIQLQIANLDERDPRPLMFRPQHAPGRRVMRLLQQHGLTWLGALRGHVLPVAYERGFLARCVAIDGDACVGAAEWSTVRDVELQGDIGIRFVGHPVMRSLTRLSGVTPRMWAQLPSLARLAVAGMTTVHIDQTALDAQRFPALVRIETRDGVVALERTATGFTRLVGRAGPALTALVGAYDADPSVLTELAVRDIPLDGRDDITAFARRQARLSRFELNGHAVQI